MNLTSMLTLKLKRQSVRISKAQPWR